MYNFCFLTLSTYFPIFRIGDIRLTASPELHIHNKQTVMIVAYHSNIRLKVVCPF